MSTSRAERSDLNLFRNFDAIMTHRSQSAAARDLGLTASAVSHALARLRVLLGDELFVPGTGSMVPTARAEAIAPHVRQALELLGALLEPPVFDPAKAQRIVRVGASDYTSMMVLPSLLRQLGQAAPGLRLRVMPIGRLDIVQQLDEGRLDLVLGWFDKMPPRIHRRAIYEEQEAIVVRRGHPLTKGAVTLERLLAFPHLVVELTGTESRGSNGFYDDRGLMRRVWVEHLLVNQSTEAERHIAATVPGYGAVGPILAGTDMVASLPLRIARQAVQRDGLALLALPYEPLRVDVEMIWHTRSNTDAGINWLADQIAQATADLQEAEA